MCLYSQVRGVASRGRDREVAPFVAQPRLFVTELIAKA